jgi:penicillin-binding protein 1A
MLLLGYINQDEYENAISQEIKIAKNINLYAVDAQHLAELVRQEVIDRYGLRAYKEGWSVYTTIDSSSQNIANQSMLDEMYIYDKRHGWREPDNYEDMFDNQEAESLKNQELDIILNDTYFGDDYLDENNIANKVSSLFDLYPYVRTHLKALVLRVSDNEIILLDENFEFKTVQWSNE